MTYCYLRRNFWGKITKKIIANYSWPWYIIANHGRLPVHHLMNALNDHGQPWSHNGAIKRPWYTIVDHGNFIVLSLLTMVILAWVTMVDNCIFMVDQCLSLLTLWYFIVNHGIPLPTMVDHGIHCTLYDNGQPWSGNGAIYRPWYTTVDHGNFIVFSLSTMVKYHGIPWFYHGIPW